MWDLPLLHSQPFRGNEASGLQDNPHNVPGPSPGCEESSEQSWGIVLSQCLESGWCEIQPALDQCCLRRTLTQPLADLAKERSDRLAHQRETDVPAGLCSPCLHPLPSLPHPTEQGCRPRRIIALNGSLRAVFFKGNFDWASFWP